MVNGKTIAATVIAVAFVPSTVFAAGSGYPSTAGRYFDACANGAGTPMVDMGNADSQLRAGYYSGPMVRDASRWRLT